MHGTSERSRPAQLEVRPKEVPFWRCAKWLVSEVPCTRESWQLSQNESKLCASCSALSYFCGTHSGSCLVRFGWSLRYFLIAQSRIAEILSSVEAESVRVRAVLVHDVKCATICSAHRSVLTPAQYDISLWLQTLALIDSCASLRRISASILSTLRSMPVKKR